MECMSTFAKYNRTLIPRKFYPRSHTFKGGLTDTTDFIITTSIPSPSSHSMKALDSNPESRLGTSNVAVGQVLLQACQDGGVTFSLS
mmetsp:Transcript_858/g.2716  ORF Transcript_858/g.2716 Transcript_858/m.2716 type:complete len:87 (+) Transcript_858:260-520(+)